MTTHPVVLDHLYVLIFAVIYPLVAFFSYQRILRLIEQGHEPPRNKLYLETIIGHWAIMFLGVLLWLGLGRSWKSMGFSFDPDWLFYLGALLGGSVIILLVMQIKGLKSVSDERIQSLHEQLEPVKPILPHSRSELHMFYKVSITAGIVEELLWRGVLIWYLSHYMPVWAAAIISAVGFGLAHSYQGVTQVPKVIAVGAVFTVLYLMTGSIWVPMILHASLDILQGRLVYEAVRHPSLQQENA
ncbi:CPBP family intramembrane glutamic endopeptidase [Pseudomonadota bacterium]